MQLIIKQIFNNNTAIVDLDDDQQAIAKGKGIAFHKSKGETLDSEKIEKIFYLDTADSQKNLYFCWQKAFCATNWNSYDRST